MTNKLKCGIIKVTVKNKWNRKIISEDKDIQKESQREELNELKQTLRLLPEGRRKALMNFVQKKIRGMPEKHHILKLPHC